MTCPNCNQEIEEGLDLCPMCGQALCPDRGAAMDDNATVCGNCGAGNLT